MAYDQLKCEIPAVCIIVQIMFILSLQTHFSMGYENVSTKIEELQTIELFSNSNTSWHPELEVAGLLRVYSHKKVVYMKAVPTGTGFLRLKKVFECECI